MKTQKFTIQKIIKVRSLVAWWLVRHCKERVNKCTSTNRECGSLSRKTLVRKAIKQFGRHRLNPPGRQYIAEALILIKNRLAARVSNFQSKIKAVLQSNRKFSQKREAKRSPLIFS